MQAATRQGKPDRAKPRIFQTGSTHQLDLKAAVSESLFHPCRRGQGHARFYLAQSGQAQEFHLHQHTNLVPSAKLCTIESFNSWIWAVTITNEWQRSQSTPFPRGRRWIDSVQSELIRSPSVSSPRGSRTQPVLELREVCPSALHVGAGPAK